LQGRQENAHKFIENAINDMDYYISYQVSHSSTELRMTIIYSEL